MTQITTLRSATATKPGLYKVAPCIDRHAPHDHTLIVADNRQQVKNHLVPTGEEACPANRPAWADIASTTLVMPPGGRWSSDDFEEHLQLQERLEAVGLGSQELA